MVIRLLAVLLSISQATNAFRGLGEPKSLGSANLPSSKHIQVEIDSSGSTITENWVELPLDHFADCSDTYRNRYYVQEAYYQPGGPVFIYDIGEESAAYYRTSLKHNNFFTRLLKEFGAMGVVWEHRYYGASYPEVQNLTYFTVEQALADLPAMAANFSRPNFPSVDLTPTSTPWVFIGGSYPGMRAAWSRMRYPDTFHAAWAASAPVQLGLNISLFWDSPIDTLTARGFAACIADTRVGNKRIDELLSDPTTSAAIKKRFLGEKAASTTNYHLANKLTLIWLSWNPRLKHTSTKGYCDLLQTDPANNQTAPPTGWAPAKGVDWVLDRMVYAFKHANDAIEEPPEEISEDLLDNSVDDTTDDTTEKRASAASRRPNSWHYQECTQLGFQAASYPNLDHFLSKYYSLHEMLKMCKRDFPGIGPLRDHQLDREFGGWHARPSNVFWTADEYDSWRAFSPLSSAPQAPPVQPSLQIPECGANPPEGEIFGYVLRGLDHCDELRETDRAHRAQRIFAKTLKTWLPCFKKKSVPVTSKSPPKCTVEA